MNLNYELFYHYSLLFFGFMIVMVNIFLILLIVKSLPMLKRIKIMQPSIENINRNAELSKRKAIAIQDKTKKTTSKLAKIVKYGLLSKVILSDFKQQERKSVGTFAKSASKGIKKQNEQQLLKRLSKHQYKGRAF